MSESKHPQGLTIVASHLSRWQRLWRSILFSILASATLAASCILLSYLYYRPTLPAFDSIEDYQPKIGTQVFSGDNQLIGEFAAERRVLVSPDKIPPLLAEAFVSAEDKRFWNHIGLDFLGIAQAILDKIRKPNSKLRGASTITQQVAKSLLVTHESYALATERTLTRKIREAFLALHLEHILTKKQIIYIYLNQIFLGHKAYGVQAAAEHYFRKNIWDLNLAEMATLAGLPQRPSDYSPYLRPKAAKARRTYVLRRMHADGHLSGEEYESALNYTLQVYPRRELYLQMAPYFTEHVRRDLVERYGEKTVVEGGLKVYTTLNIQAQHIAQNALKMGLTELDKRQGFRGPLANIPKKKRALFIGKYREELGLTQEQQVDFTHPTTFLAMVNGFGARGQIVKLNIAGKDALLPLAGMIWAREPNPIEKYDTHQVKDVRRRLKVGDVITVEKTTRYRLSRDKHAWEIVNTVPKNKDDMLFRLVQEPIAQAAVMSVDPRTGYVHAKVGGYHFEKSSFNRATQACREPGSAFKPIVYSAAIDKLDYTASTLIDDKPLVFDDAENEARWKPNNAGLRFRGSIPMRTCLMDSINIPAIRIANAVGIQDLINNARNLGITTHLKRELGVALGSSCTTLRELVKVYTTINQYGRHRPLHFIRRIVDRHGNVLEENSDPADPVLRLRSRLDRAYAKLVTPRKRVLDPPTGFLTVRLMQNVVNAGTAIGASRLGLNVAGKTGTTDDSYDAWFVGFTPQLVTGVWVGHDKKERPLGVTEQGGRTALPIWTRFMDRYARDYNEAKPKRINHGEFTPPFGVVKVAIDPETGLLARPEMAFAEEWYRQGSEPTDFAPDKAVFDPEEFNLFEIDPG
jgi:penicillin-binding protein 1A